MIIKEDINMTESEKITIRNTNFNFLARILGLDYTIEKSENIDPSEGWVWKKYASGIAECWIHININVLEGTNLYAIPYPFEFVNPPSININIGRTNSSECYIKMVDWSNWRAYFHAYSDAADDGWVDIQVKGRWK